MLTSIRRTLLTGPSTVVLSPLIFTTNGPTSSSTLASARTPPTSTSPSPQSSSTPQTRALYSSTSLSFPQTSSPRTETSLVSRLLRLVTLAMPCTTVRISASRRMPKDLATKLAMWTMSRSSSRRATELRKIALPTLHLLETARTTPLAPWV